MRLIAPGLLQSRAAAGAGGFNTWPLCSAQAVLRDCPNVLCRFCGSLYRLGISISQLDMLLVVYYVSQHAAPAQP